MDIITTENMHEYSEQQVFDYVVEHLYKQGEPSMQKGGGGRCAYRGENGLKCAAGILISDKIYKKSWDKVGTSYNCLVIKESLPQVHDDLISSLQVAHDSWAGTYWQRLDQLTDELKRVATKFRLEFDPSK